MTLEQIQQSLDAGIITQAQADAMRVKIADKASAASENPDMAMIGNCLLYTSPSPRDS